MQWRTGLLLSGLAVIAVTALLVYTGVYIALNPAYEIQATPLSHGVATGPPRVIDVEATGIDPGSRDIVGSELSRSGQFAIVGAGSSDLPIGASIAGYPVLASGKDLDPAGISVGLDGFGRPALNLRVRDPATTRIATYTSSHVGTGHIAFAVGGKVLSDPIIQGAVTDGASQITTNSVRDAAILAIVLKLGASPTARRLRVTRVPLPIAMVGLPRQATAWSAALVLAGVEVLVFWFWLYPLLRGPGAYYAREQGTQEIPVLPWMPQSSRRTLRRGARPWKTRKG